MANWMGDCAKSRVARDSALMYHVYVCTVLSDSSTSLSSTVLLCTIVSLCCTATTMHAHDLMKWRFRYETGTVQYTVLYGTVILCIPHALFCNIMARTRASAYTHQQSVGTNFPPYVHYVQLVTSNSVSTVEPPSSKQTTALTREQAAILTASIRKPISMTSFPHKANTVSPRIRSDTVACSSRPSCCATSRL